MAHTFGDKIRGSYDKSQMMEERRDFMVAWSDALVEQGLITSVSCYFVSSGIGTLVWELKFSYKSKFFNRYRKPFSLN